MSDAAFSKLSGADRVILLEEFRTGGQDLAKLSADLENTIRADFEKQGVTFHTADIEAYRKATASF